MKQGLFITFEGPDGSGKSTQARLLAEDLTTLKFEIVLTREPGGTPLAEEIRRVILTPSAEPLDPLAEIMLYTAARAQHVRQLIQPALAAGKIVICERFVDSSLAYQGYGLGWDREFIKEINRMAIGEFQPDLTFLLDLEITECKRRLTSRTARNKQGADRIESRGVDFQAKVSRGFREIAAANSRIAQVEVTNKTIRAIHSELLNILSSKLDLDLSGLKDGETFLAE
ncbi:MAG TPA: dTMP kinase [Bacillota bacterium]|nr:dTMP kinase [Bacillota bacterium]